MNQTKVKKNEIRKNIYDLARELAIIVDKMDQTKGNEKQIEKKLN